MGHRSRSDRNPDKADYSLRRGALAHRLQEAMDASPSSWTDARAEAFAKLVQAPELNAYLDRRGVFGIQRDEVQAEFVRRISKPRKNMPRAIEPQEDVPGVSQRFRAYMFRTLSRVVEGVRTSKGAGGRFERRFEVARYEEASTGTEPGLLPDGLGVVEGLSDSMLKALARLDRQVRDIVVLKLVHGLTYEEIAIREGLSFHAVVHRLESGLERLRRHLAASPPLAEGA